MQKEINRKKTRQTIQSEEKNQDKLSELIFAINEALSLLRAHIVLVILFMSFALEINTATFST